MHTDALADARDHEADLAARDHREADEDAVDALLQHGEPAHLLAGDRRERESRGEAGDPGMRERT